MLNKGKSHQPLIFVVDRNTNYRNLIINSLAAINYTNVRAFDSAGKCIEMINLCPDIVIQDYQPNGNEGTGLLRKTKRMNPETDFIFLSAQRNPEVVVEILKSGAADYIAKTKYAISKLAGRIDQLVMSKQRMKKLIRQQYQLICSLGLIFFSIVSLVIYYTLFG